MGQIWHLEHGTLNVKGDADWMREANKIKIDEKKEEVGESVDKFGNTVILKRAKGKSLFLRTSQQSLNKLVGWDLPLQLPYILLAQPEGRSLLQFQSCTAI